MSRVMKYIPPIILIPIVPVVIAATIILSLLCPVKWNPLMDDRDDT